MSRFITTWSRWTVMVGGMVVALCPSFAGEGGRLALGSSPSENRNVSFRALADFNEEAGRDAWDRSESAAEETTSNADFYFHRYGRLAACVSSDVEPAAKESSRAACQENFLDRTIAEENACKPEARETMCFEELTGEMTEGAVQSEAEQYVQSCPAEDAEQVPPAETYEGPAATSLAIEEVVSDNSDETRVTLDAILAETKAREEDARLAAELADMANPFDKEEVSTEATSTEEASEEAAYHLAATDVKPADNAAAMQSDNLAPEGLSDCECQRKAPAYQEAEYQSEVAGEYRPNASEQQESNTSANDSAEEDTTEADTVQSAMVLDEVAARPMVFDALKSLIVAPLTEMFRTAETTSVRLAATAKCDWTSIIPQLGEYTLTD